MDNRPIGIFDSGIGGLTVVSEVVKALPDEEIIYFGDTARVPYGSKSKEIVTKFSKQIVNFLLTKDVKAIIIACNTISSNCFDELSQAFDIHFVEVISSGVTACLQARKNEAVGVIATEATIRSGLYETLLKKARPGIRVYSKACPLFVPLAEESWTENIVAKITVEVYLQELLDKGIDALLLGCTHYPLLYPCLKSAVGDVEIINPAEVTAQKMKAYLTERNMLRAPQNTPSHTFYVSDNTKKFNRICEMLLKKDYDAVIVDIEAY